MKLFRRDRDYQPGQLLTVHRGTIGDTVQGSYVRTTDRYLVLNRYSIEQAGTLHQMKGDLLMVPHAPDVLVEVRHP